MADTNIEWMIRNEPEPIAKGLALHEEPCGWCAWRGTECDGNGRKCWEGVLEWMMEERNGA